VHDAQVLSELLHGDETRVYGDQVYRGQRDVIREHAQKAKDFTNRRYRHCDTIDEVERGKNRTTRECLPYCVRPGVKRAGSF
jgi:IS5 family transposase